MKILKPKAVDEIYKCALGRRKKIYCINNKWIVELTYDGVIWDWYYIDENGDWIGV